MFYKTDFLALIKKAMLPAQNILKNIFLGKLSYLKFSTGSLLNHFFTLMKDLCPINKESINVFTSFSLYQAF